MKRKIFNSQRPATEAAAQRPFLSPSALRGEGRANSRNLPLNIMEVCGTHTNAIAKSGLKTLLAGRINFISGPGCPVCVSAQSDIDNMLALALKPGVITATFGDMLRVPGAKMSLKDAQTAGADVRIIYSPLQAVDIAQKNPNKKIIFLAVGFETTAPAAAAAVLAARKLKLKNFYVYTALKRVAPAVELILKEKNNIDGFLLPGNVSVITGLKEFDFISEKYAKPAAAAGFSAKEILAALAKLGKPKTQNAYAWVKAGGNKTALRLTAKVFTPAAGSWRGFGKIEQSALELKEEFAAFDAKKVFKIRAQKERKTKCRCALILKGKIPPQKCPYFARVCTPQKPLGPCMVSQEGACAAAYNNMG
ncbi:MAG: hydrogenase formation protein HypD [Elusimicrobiota bacterium]|jgi:hydrogenase expression/formation protein HypD|nr:hydrogenase formation protein HypD [Elusimicrobiota bacterium]